MEQFLGKKVFIEIENTVGKTVIFNAIVLDVSKTHITFRDKYNDIYSYKIDSIVTIQERKKEDEAIKNKQN